MIEAQVEVDDASRFHLEGTLATLDGTLLAWSQSAATLGPGLGWIPLTFYGLALHEMGRDGPYRLRFAALTTTGEMPNQKSALVRDGHVTAFYRAGDFRTDAFEDPDLIDAAERLERSGGFDPGALEVGPR